MSRYEKRKEQRQAEKILNKAKQDMQEYAMEYAAQTEGVPTEWELKAWQKGYIAGLNRAKSWKDD